MESIQALASTCRVAAAHDSVLNTECCYTFYTPYNNSSNAGSGAAGNTGDDNGGIVVSLHSFMGTVPELAMLGLEEETETITSSGPKEGIFVRIVKERVVKEKDAAMDEEEADATTTAAAATTAAPTKLGIGVDGGFLSDDDKYETISKHSVVVLRVNDGNDSDGTLVTVTELPYTEETKASFPTQVSASVDSILNHVGMTVQQDVKVWQLDTDEGTVASQHAASLPFVDNGVVIDSNPTTWKCAASGATDNIWLNLSDGYVGGGRQNWDGSGGSNGALDHYVATGRLYPLVVKLGTITADLSTADCYSYAAEEDGPVQIPNLAALLERRGIYVAGMQKTAKSTAEMEVELNANYAFDAITEAGAQLEPLAGAGLQGLQNLGNSCYLNSVVQLLLSGTVTELANRYGCGANATNAGANASSSSSVTQHELLRRVSTRQAPEDLLCQTTKVACALTSGVFAKPAEVLRQEADSNSGSSDSSSPTTTTANDPRYRLAPRMFKHVVGKDHVDFRTGQQQDAAQFLQYFLERLDRAERGAAAVLTKKQKSGGDGGDEDAAAAAAAPLLHVASDIFSFATSSRMVCSADQKVKYKDSAPETVWSLRLPMDKAVVVMEEKEAGTGAGGGATVGVPDQKRFKPEESKEEKKPVPTIAFQTCLEEWAADTQVDDVRWPHLNNVAHAATEQTRFSNFPRYLLVQIQRYQLGPDWAPIKLEVNLDIPQDIDLTAFKSTGPVEGENLIPVEEKSSAQETAGVASAAAAGPAISETGVSQLMDMGFSLNSCKRALTAVGGSDVEAAMGWVFEHNEDPDFNDPLPEPTQGGAPVAGGAASGSGVDEGVVQSLVENLGCFTADHVRAALKETSGAADRAADWLFSHMDDLDGAVAALESKNQSQQLSASASTSKVPLEDGEGKYTMVGLVSHIGKNTGSGHYVAHLKKDGKWVIFNDEKVAVSSQPPIQHAYMYLFQRTDSVGSPNPNY